MFHKAKKESAAKGQHFLHISLVLGLHCGDLESLEFIAPYSPVYPYIFALNKTFKSHNFTSFFMKPVLVDVISDVSDVTYISYAHL